MRRRPVIAASALALVAGLGGGGVALAAGGDGTNVSPGAGAGGGASAARAAAVPADGADLFTPLDACTVLRGTIGRNASRTVTVSGGSCAVPASATAVTYAVTAAKPSGGPKRLRRVGGYVLVSRPGAPRPATRAASYARGVVGSGSGLVKVDPAGPARTIAVANRGKAPVRVTLQVTGYYAPQLSAFVQGNGTLTAGTRVLSSTRTSLGRYTVVFDRSVRDCAYVATPYAQNWEMAVGPGGTADSVNVFIHDPVSPFTSHDTSFFLQVSC